MKTWNSQTSLNELLEIRENLLKANPALRALQDEIDLATAHLTPLESSAYCLAKAREKLSEMGRGLAQLEKITKDID